MPKITAVVGTIPHSNPQRLVDMWAKIVVKELLRLETTAKEQAP